MFSDLVPARGVPKVRGVASVQLDGATVAQVENFVSPRMLGSLAYLGDRYLIAPRSASTSPAAAGLLGSSSPFSGMVLTDFDQEPQPEYEVVIDGVVLAGGSVNGTASGERKGNFNVPESRFEAGYLRLVWDFATNQANGVFQSIYLFPGDVSPTTGIPSTQFPLATASQSGTLWAASLNKDGDWYYYATSGVLYRADLDNILSRLAGYSYIEETLGSLPGISSSAGAFVKDNTAYWVQSASPYNIRSAPISDLASFTNIRTHPAGVSHAGSSRGCAVSYWPDGEGWIVGNTNTSGSWAIAKLHDDFSDWEVYGTSGDSRLSTMTPCWGLASMETQVSSSQQVFQISDTDSRFRILHNTGANIILLYNLVSDKLGVAGTTGSGGPHAPTSTSMFFSRALLEEPVTKTNVNTMKITYELTWG